MGSVADVLAWLVERIQSREEAPCLVHNRVTYTYGDLLREVVAARTLLAERGVTAGDVVALQGDYSLQSVAWLIALALYNAIVVPIAAATDEETHARLEVSRAAWLVKCGTDVSEIVPLELVREDPPTMVSQLRARGNAGLILFSSGTSAEPKAMLHDLTGLLESYSGRRLRSLRGAALLMFDHIGGLNTLMSSLASGMCLVVPRSRDPEEVASLVQEFQINLLPASPTFLNLLLLSGADKRYDLSSLKVVTYGTEPMSPSVLARVRAALPQAKLHQTFGTSETGISQTVSASSGSTSFRIDDPGTEVRIVDGELWLRSKTQILGYLNADMSRFTEDGWFRTGDLVNEAGDGYFVVAGRVSEVINVGGLKVLPVEVESVLLEMDELADCVVYGVPSPITGQVVGVDVLLKGVGNGGNLKASIRRHCGGRLEAYKIPVRVRVVEQIAAGARLKKTRRERPATAEKA